MLREYGCAISEVLSIDAQTAAVTLVALFFHHLETAHSTSLPAAGKSTSDTNRILSLGGGAFEVGPSQSTVYYRRHWWATAQRRAEPAKHGCSYLWVVTFGHDSLSVRKSVELSRAKQNHCSHETRYISISRSSQQAGQISPSSLVAVRPSTLRARWLAA